MSTGLIILYVSTNGVTDYREVDGRIRTEEAAMAYVEKECKGKTTHDIPDILNQAQDSFLKGKVIFAKAIWNAQPYASQSRYFALVTGI